MKMTAKGKNGERGFTLVELLTIIAIVCVLAALLLPALRRAREKAKYTRWCGYKSALCYEPSLVAYYTFEDTGVDTLENGAAGDITNDTYVPAKLNGTINGATWITNGGRWIEKKTLSFDGTNDYVRVNTTDLYTNTTSLEAWTKTSSTKSYQAVLGSNITEKYEILLKTGSYPCNIEVSLKGGNYVQWNGVLPQGEWTHIAVVASNGIQWKLYLNGVDKGAPNIVGGTYQVEGTGVSYVDIGRIRNDAGFTHAGLIDEVAIYNRALSANEIKGHYEMGKP